MTAPEPARRAGRHLAPALIGVVVSVALLVWAMKDVDFRRVGSEIAGAHPLPLVASIIVATASFMVRAFRWGLLVRDDHGRDVPLRARWDAVAMGFMANNILPLRAGEVLRAYAITRLAPVRFTGSIASLVVERVFDALTLVLLLSVGLLLSGLSTSTMVAGVSVARIATVTAIAGLLVVGCGVLLVARPALLHGLIERLVPEGRLRARFMSLADGIADGLVVLRSPARLAALVAWSVGMWLASAASFWLMFRAFGIGVGFSGALVLQSTMAFGISVPSTPGYIGPFEAIIVAVLGVYGVPNTLAFSYAITYHLTTLVPITLLGVWSLARSGITLRDVRARADA